METFPEKLMSARKAKGLTQEALAQMLNVSRQTVSHWENGRALPDLETTRRLTQLLGVDFIVMEQEVPASAPDPLPTPPEAPTASAAPATPPESASEPPQAAVTEPTRRRSDREQTDSRFSLPTEALVAYHQSWLRGIICVLAVLALVCAGFGIARAVAKAQKAEITLTVPAGSEYWRVSYEEGERFDGWSIYLTCTNVSDVPFTPEHMVAKWYIGDRVDDRLKVDAAYMRNWMDSNALIQGESPLVLLFQSDRSNYDRVEFLLDGTDDNGHAQRYSLAMDLLPAQE